jgi:hypothetical protein
MSVALSLEETYADVVPLRSGGGPSAFVSIMRGCNNMWAAGFRFAAFSGVQLIVAEQARACAVLP